MLTASAISCAPSFILLLAVLWSQPVAFMDSPMSATHSFIHVDDVMRAYLSENFLCHGISFDGLLRFQREFHPDVLAQATGKEVYQMVLEYTKPPERRPFIKIPYNNTSQPFFSPDELGPGNVYVSYQWDAPFSQVRTDFFSELTTDFFSELTTMLPPYLTFFSQVFEAVASLPHRSTSFFMIHVLCCPSEDTLRKHMSVEARIEWAPTPLTHKASFCIDLI